MHRLFTGFKIVSACLVVACAAVTGSGYDHWMVYLGFGALEVANLSFHAGLFWNLVITS
jgi:hypothetical protein